MTAPKRTLHDDSKRLLDLVCNALRAANQDSVGEYMVRKVAGTGKLFIAQGPFFVFRTSAELAMREIVGLCTTRMPDELRKQRCMAILRRLEARPA